MRSICSALRPFFVFSSFMNANQNNNLENKTNEYGSNYAKDSTLLPFSPFLNVFGSSFFSSPTISSSKTITSATLVFLVLFQW